MARPAALHRLRRVGAANLRLLAEALPTLIVASAAIRLRPFRKVAASASRAVAPRAAPVDEAFVRKLIWSVNAWADRVPWRAVCFQRGLAVHMMLRRRGIESVLNYGVAQSPDEGVKAHVWITVAGRAVIGGEEAPRFTRLAAFPDEKGLS